MSIPIGIPIGIAGRILNSPHKDHLVRVDEDRTNTNGFLIYERWENSGGPNAGGWFDNWVENSDSLIQFFTEAQWDVQWEANPQHEKLGGNA